MTTETIPHTEASALNGLVILLLAVAFGAAVYLAFFEHDTLPTAIKYMMEEDVAASSEEM